MKIQFKLLYFTILTSAILFGCQNQFKAEFVDHENSLFWQIKKEGQPTSYMYGTMHMINKEFYNFGPNITSCLKQSDAVIMEVAGMPNPIQIMLLMTLKEGNLKSIFSENQWHDLLQFYDKEFGIDESEFVKTYNSFKPFFLFQSMTQAYFEKDAESYDLNIMKIAKENNIDIIGLETIQQQIGFFDQIPNSEMSKMIMESLKTYKEDLKDFETLQVLYSNQKIDEMLPLMKEQSPEFLKYEDLFLKNRNKNWIPELIKNLSNQSCFVAVGAAHLFDEDGLISLLKSEGFTVLPLKKI
ncbi:MAG: TraB/GumN family protein [Crocinitomicaceae bacterium]